MSIIVLLETHIIASNNDLLDYVFLSVSDFLILPDDW